MKLTLISKAVVSQPELLQPSTPYEVVPMPWGGCTFHHPELGVVSADTKDFLSPIEHLEYLLRSTAEKAEIAVPRQGQTVEVYRTEKHLVVYAHTKGSHYNMGGTHYRHFHDVSTGNITFDHNLTGTEYSAKPIFKERMLKAKAVELRDLALEMARKLFEKQMADRSNDIPL